MNIPQHIVDRLEDYRDGCLDQSGCEVLTSWIKESREHGRSAAAWFMSEAELLEAARIADLCAVFETLPFDVRNGEAGYSAKPNAASQTSQPARRVPLNWYAIAATLLVAISTVVFLATQARQTSQAPAPLAQMNPPGAPSTPVEPVLPPPAVLGRLAQCVWDSGMQPLRVGQDIASGTVLRMKSGRAQLVFENGAEVVLQGPCRFRVDDSKLCRLELGSVSAHVPPRAAGFTIRGPSSEVIDLGTRFGFAVGAAGESEVHVFQGEVISRQLDESGRVFGNEIRLKKNQAVLFPGARKQAQRLAANEAKFVLRVRPLWRRERIEPLVVDRHLALWLRAAHGVQIDPKQRVVAWQDLAIGDNRVANDAFQPEAKARPLLVRNAIGGRAAIRFDGQQTYLTTTPMTTADNQTIVAVFQYAKPVDDKSFGGQIINYNGPPSRYLPDIYSPGVLQLGEKIGDTPGPLLSIAAKAFVGKDSSKTDVSAGVVRSKSLGHSTLHAVAYTYSHAQNAAALYVDGVQVSQSTAPTKVAVTSRKVIGKHGIFDQWYFHGDLAELIIYNTALDPADIEHLSSQLLQFHNAAAADKPNL